MNNHRIVVGLDIGTTKICALVGRKNKYGKIEILGLGNYPSYGVTSGVVTNIQKTVDSILKAITEAEENANIDIKIVNVGIAGRHIQSTLEHGVITRENVDEEIFQKEVDKLTNDMYKIISPPGTKIIHAMPQEYSVDQQFGIKDPIGMTGVKLEGDFHIITARTAAINNIYKCIKKSNLEIENLILEPLASSLAVLSEEEKEAGVCLIDIGGGTSDIAIFYDSIIRHTAVIPFGGDIITEDIKQAFSITLNQAELIKTKFGSAIANKDIQHKAISIPGINQRSEKKISSLALSSVIEARLEEIIEMINTNISASGYEDKLAAGLVITGGGAQLNYVRQLFEYVTGNEVRIGYPNEHLGEGLDIAKNPMYSTGVGLILSGFTDLHTDFETQKMEDSIFDTSTAESSIKNKKPTKSSLGKDFFKKILEKTKSLLIDDV